MNIMMNVLTTFTSKIIQLLYCKNNTDINSFPIATVIKKLSVQSGNMAMP